MDTNKDHMKQGYYGYCRKSSEGEDRQSESIPAQLNELELLAKRKEIVIYKIFTESKSAKEPGRPEFNKMVELIEKEPIKGIVCWDSSRLFRNPVDEGKIRWLLDTGKIEEIITPYKTYTKEDSSLIMAIEGGKNHSFIQDLRRNTARGVQRKIDRGIAPILAPVGYENNTHKRQGEKDISPHPVYFDLVREIFNLALTGNYSVQKLYEKAKSMEIKNNRGKVISRTQMYRLLTNPFYVGSFEYAGRIYDGIHKPMISNEEYEIIQDNLNERSRPREASHEWILTGLITCGVCGRQITAEKHTKKSGKVYSYYKCTGKYRYDCTTPYVPIEELEEAAYNYLAKIRLSASFVEWAIKVLKRATDEERNRHTEKFKHLRKEYDRTDSAIYNLKMKWATTEEIDDDLYYKEVGKLKSDRKRIKNKLKGQEQDFDQTTNITVATFKFARDAQKKWNEKGIEYKKGILRVISSRLVLNNIGKLEIKPRTPFLLIEKALSDKAKVQPRSKISNTRLNSQFEPNTGSEDFSSTIMGE